MTYQAMTNLETQYHQTILPYKQLFNLLIDHTPAAIALLDSQLRYIKVSQRWLSDYGFSEPDIIGKFHYEVFPGITEHWKQIYKDCQAGKTQRWEEYLPPEKSGTIQQIKWEVKPWFAESETEQFFPNSNPYNHGANHYLKTEKPGLIVFAEKVTNCNINPALGLYENIQCGLKECIPFNLTLGIPYCLALARQWA